MRTAAVIGRLQCVHPTPATTMALTPAEKQRLYRERQAGRLPAVVRLTCTRCSRKHTGIHGDLCWVCERLTPEGRARNLAAVQRSRVNKLIRSVLGYEL